MFLRSVANTLAPVLSELQGAFIIEYVGEVIDEQGCRDRLKEQEKAGIDSFYILSIDATTHIDARVKVQLGFVD